MTNRCLSENGIVFRVQFHFLFILRLNIFNMFLSTSFTNPWKMLFWRLQTINKFEMISFFSYFFAVLLILRSLCWTTYAVAAKRNSFRCVYFYRKWFLSSIRCRRIMKYSISSKSNYEFFSSLCHFFLLSARSLVYIHHIFSVFFG